MATVKKIQIPWTGAIGLPGVSTFYTEASQDNVLARLRVFFEAWKTAIPNIVTITYPTAGVTIDTATGETNGSWTAPPRGTTVGTANTPYSAPTGVVYSWHTGAYIGGRELRGKTFLVPVVGAVFNTAGQIITGDLPAYAARGNALVGTGEFADDPLAIYSRRNATVAPARTATISPRAAVLRSRRD